MALAIKGQLVEHPSYAQDVASKPLPIAGFGGGTLIATDDGPIPVDWLRPGDKVLTYDNGFQPVRWIGRDCLQCPPEEIPAIRLPVRRLMPDTSLRNPVLAARHRVVLCGWQVELYFGMDTILAEAGFICEKQEFFPARKPGTASCSHILMDKPNIIQANGAWVETMQLSESAVGCLNDEAAETIDRLGIDTIAHASPVFGGIHAWEAKQLGLDLINMLACDGGRQGQT